MLDGKDTIFVYHHLNETKIVLVRSTSYYFSGILSVCDHTILSLSTYDRIKNHHGHFVLMSLGTKNVRTYIYIYYEHVAPRFRVRDRHPSFYS